MTDPLHAIAARLAAALRTSQDRCLRDYDMKVVAQCSRCKALAEWDAFTKIVQLPGVPVKERK